MATAKITDDPKSDTVEVEALQVHTYNGKEYQVGDTYDIEAQYADSVAAQGKAIRTDRVEKAQADAKASERTSAKRAQDAAASDKTIAKARAKAGARASRPVAPMTTSDFGVDQAANVRGVRSGKAGRARSTTASVRRSGKKK
jgi:hypothetical protein